MRKRNFLILLLCSFMPWLSAETAQQTGDLNLTVTNANNNSGAVRVALYDSNSAYAADKRNAGEGALRKAAVEIKNKKAECSFKELPFGHYAIKVYHDEDNSNNFYTGTFGIPKVQYGFSNNAKGLMGPASFQKAMFDFNKPQVSMIIELSR